MTDTERLDYAIQILTHAREHGVESIEATNYDVGRDWETTDSLSDILSALTFSHCRCRIKPTSKKRPIRPDELPPVVIVQYPNTAVHTDKKLDVPRIKEAIKLGCVWSEDGGRTWKRFEVEEQS